MSRKVSDFDISTYHLIRKNILDFLENQANKIDSENIRLLDIAPQVHAGAKQFFKKSKVFTADISPDNGADYIIDITKNNSKLIQDNSFDVVVCTEVLEHTLNPFDAAKELHRILKDGGLLLVSTPFNFRIHGPLPDCWRFTIHGIRELLKDFKQLQIDELDDPDRFLMPLHYTTVAIK